MSRVVMAVLIVVVALAGGIRAQQARPDLAGRWALVDSTPSAEQKILDSALVIGQTADQFTVEQRARIIHFGPESRATSESGGTVRSTYVTDGAEHDLPAPQLPAMTGSIRVVAARHAGTYRAIWSGPQLIVITHDSQILTRRDQSSLTLRRVVRQAFTLGKDGALAVDVLIIADPLPEGFFFNAPEVTQEPPVNARTVYRRAQ